MKVLLVGAGGQVGTELLALAGSGDEWVATTRTGGCTVDGITIRALDLGDPVAIRQLIAEQAPDVVINAAAYTAVDRAESEPELAFAINAKAPEAMARACAEGGARLVHYSTDYVFDGRGTRPYREDDPTCPLGVYGASKLAGEDAIRGVLADHLILRTAWVYAAHGQNFLRTMLRVGAERDELRVVDDQVGSPTPAGFIADATVQLIRTDATGVCNVVTAGSTSWCGFARAIFARAEQVGVIGRIPNVAAIGTSDYPTPAQRPAYSVLDTRRLTALGVQPPTWDAALAGVIRQLGGASAAGVG